MNYTRHAAQRMTERSIPPAMIDLLMEFGEPEHHKGCVVYRISRKGEKRMSHYYGRVADALIKEVRSYYVVADGDTVVTASRSTRHLKRERH